MSYQLTASERRFVLANYEIDQMKTKMECSQSDRRWWVAMPRLSGMPRRYAPTKGELMRECLFELEQAERRVTE